MIKLWEVGTGRELRTLKGHAGAVYAIVFDHAGKRLLSASADRTVKIWDVKTGSQIGRPLGESSAELYSLALHPSGKLLAAAGEDKMIRIWKLHEGQGGELSSSFFAHDSSVLRLAFTPRWPDAHLRRIGSAGQVLGCRDIAGKADAGTAAGLGPGPGAEPR